MENEFETIILQAEDLTIDTTLANNDGTLARTRTQNQERDGRNGFGADVVDQQPGPEDEFDDYGLRLDYSGEGYVDLNGAAGDKLSFDVNGDSGIALPGGTYDISVRVAASGSREILLKVLDGGTVVETTAAQDGNSGEFFQWTVLTFQITIPDGAPARTIMVEQTTSAGPNIDAIAIAAPGTQVTFAAPEIQTASLAIAENETVAGQVVATDLQDVTGTGSELSFSIVGGADADKLTIDEAGTLTFDAAPDHEAPADEDGDNVYDVTVEVSDGAATATRDISVTVEDVANELPNPTIAQIVLQGEDADIGPEGESFARTQAEASADLENGYQSTTDQYAEGAANSNKNGNAGEPLDAYGLREGYSGHGYLDFESGTDETIGWSVNVAQAGNYDLHIRYANGDEPRPLDILVGGTVQHGSEPFDSTGFQNWVVKTLTVQLEAGDNDLALAIAGNTNGPNIDAVVLTSTGDTATFPVTNSAPVFAETGPTGIEVDENTTAVGSFAATDADPGDTVEYSLSGADSENFEIDAAGNLEFAVAPDFETGPTSFEVTVQASDGKISASRDVTVTVSDVAETNAAPIEIAVDTVTVEENADGAVIGILSATDPDGDDASIVFSVDPDSDFEITGTTLKLKDGVTLDHEAAETVNVDVTATDADGASSVQTLAISVGDVNEAPSLGSSAALTPTVSTEGGLVDLSALSVIDPDAGDTATLGVRLAGGSDAPAGVEIDSNGDLVVPAGLTPGNLVLELFATDGELESEPFPVTVTVEEPVDPAYEVPSAGDLVIQLENRDGSIVINDDTPGDGEGDPDATQFRDSSNPEGNNDGGKVNNLWPDFNGSGYLDMGAQAGDQAAFDVTVQTAGEYTFAFRYNNGSTFNDGTRPMAIAVNGTVLATPTFANNGLDWTDWQTETVNLALPAGTSTISLTNTVANGPNFDQVTISLAAAVNEAPEANDGTAVTSEDAAITIDVADLIADDTDDDADLTVIAESDDGSVVVDGTSILFTPAADFSGDAVITYRAVDSDGATSEDASITVTVSGTDDAPTAVTLTPVPVAENAAGAAVATVVVTDADTVYAASDLVLDDGAGLFELETTGTPNTFTLKLVETASLDFEAASQPSVTVSAAGVVSEPFTPMPSDDPADNAPETVEIDFGTAEITSYTGNQDSSGLVTASEDGGSAEFAGNLWKRVALGQDYTITGDTKLKVTISTGTPVSEMVAIGFDLDENFSDSDGTIYQLAGTQRYAPFVDLSQAGTDNGDGTTTYEIELSSHAGVTISSLVFVADDDNAGNGIGAPVFSNVSLTEDAGIGEGNLAPGVVGGGIADLVVDEGSVIEIDLPFVDRDGPQPLSYGYTIVDGEGADVTGAFGLSLDGSVLSGTLSADILPGTYTVTVTADDGEAVSTDSFVVTVDNVNEAPVVDPGVAPEPVIGKVGEPIPGIDLAQFDGLFTDPDGDALTITVEGLPDGLSIDGEGVIVGTPTEAGAGFFTIVATDPGGLRAELQIPLQLDAPEIGDVIVVEAEDFTGLADADEFYATGQAGASGDQIIRVAGAGDVASVTTNLAQNGLLEGWYQVAMTRYDETDGSATYTLQIGDTVLADDAAFDGTPDQEGPNDTFDNSNGRGGAGQTGNIKTITFDTAVYVDANTVLTLSGVSNGELLRTDRFTFTRVAEPNEAPSAPTLTGAEVAENADGVTIGILSATDPDGDDAAITFSVGEASPFEVVGDELRLKAGEAFDFETDGGSVSVDVTATDESGATSQASLSITVVDIDEAPSAVTMTPANLAENEVGAVVGTLQATDPEGAAITFAVDDARFEVVGGDQLTLKAGEALDFETEPTVTVEVTATDETGNATVTAVTLSVSNANDAPVMPAGASVADQSVEAGTGATIDLSTLGATDPDPGDTVTYSIAGEAALAAGFLVEADGTTLSVPASAPSGTYEVTVFATDGTADSESVSFTLTVGDPAPFEPIVIEAENDAFASISLAQPADDDSTQVRDPQNPESNPDLVNGLRPGFSGDGYLDFGNDAGDTLTIAVTVPSSGQYDLNFRYATNTDRPLDLAVNGSGVSALTFTSTDPDGTGQQQGFDNWLFETVTVDLVAGANSVALSIPAGATSGPNIDRVEITAPGTGPISADNSADADEFPLSLDGDTGELTPTQAASINLNVTGLDTDIVTVELSFDGGATRQDVTALLDSDGDFVIDGSELAAGPQTATIIVTDAAGNEAQSDLSFSIAGPGDGTFEPVTIQGEDATITDVPGAGTGNEIVALRDGDTDAFGNTVGIERTGALGEDGGYLDYGNTPGDTAAFTITVPTDGIYTATFRYANGDTEDRPLNLKVNGNDALTVPFSPTVAGGGGDNWNAWTDVTVELDLAAGENTVALTIPSDGDNGPNIDQVTFELKDDGDTGSADAQVFEEIVKINFEAPLDGNGGFNAPSGYKTPEGFEADTGAAYGDRGNGFTYGWVDIDDSTGAVTGTPLAQPTGSMRYKNDASEASDLQKTYAHFDYPGAPSGDRERAWEMEVEDGVYQLTVAIGDTAGQYDSRYVLNVEGEEFGPSWDPVNLAGEKLVGGDYSASLDGEGFRSNLYTGIVEVADGRLTIDGTDGDNVEIQWLDLERVPDLTPNDGRSADLDYSKFVSAVAASTQEGQVSIEVGGDGSVPLDIDPTSSIVVGVELQAIDHRGPSVEFVDGIRLYKTLTGEEVAIDVQITGGADSLTIRPLQELDEFTSYTLDIQDVLDLGNLTDSDLPQRQFQDYSTTFVTGEAPEDVAKEVAFTDTVVIDGFADGGAAFTSIEFGPDGKLYVSTITGQIHRWDVNSDGSLDKASQETLSLDYFQDTGRSIIGLAFDPEDPNTIWVSDNAPVPRTGKADQTPEFSGQVSKITLGANGSFEGATAETYITGLPRSGGDHVTNSLEFRNVGTDADPEYLLYVMQGSNSAAGDADNAWGFRPERLLNAAALEIDPRRDAPDGGFDVQTEPYDPATNDPTYRDAGSTFNADGTVDGFFDPFATDAVLRIFGEGIRNGYDLVWHSNGNLYVPTNGTARGGNAPDDPTTPTVDESVSGLDKQYDYIFQVQEGGYYGHPNPLLGNYIVNGGSGTQTNIYGDTNAANTPDGGNEYPDGIDPSPKYDIDGAYSLGFNKSPNGAIEYTGDLFGANLKGALLFAQFSVGDNVRVLNVDEVTGRIIGDDVLRRPNGDEIDEYIDPLDIIENPVTGQLYLMTLNRGTGESMIVLLNPAPGGVLSDTTADENGDLALTVDAADPEDATFTIFGADADLVSLTVTFTDGTNSVTRSADGNGTFSVDLSGLTGSVTATLAVADGSANTASDSVSFTLGGDPNASVFLDATAFTVLSTLSGDEATLIRNINDPSTHEPGDTNDFNGDGLNDGYDGISYLDPNGGAEDKAEFTFDAPAAGTYTFSFRMAANSDRTIAFEANGDTETVTVNTGNFTVWQSYDIVLTMEAGPNTITISQPGVNAPNIDSVTITPLDVADGTADEFGDLDLVATDLSDASAAVFTISGADADLTSLSVTFTDGTTTATAIPSGNGDFTVDLSALSGSVSATLTVSDGTNTATENATFTLGTDTIPNDGSETVGGVAFTIYEAENAQLDGPVVDTDPRGQSGGEFVDYDGTADQTVTWTIEVAQDGDYQVDFLYALASTKEARPLLLTIDGQPAGTLAFEPNSNEGETLWGPQTAQLSLAAGVHTVALTAPLANGPNLDYLRITSQPLGEPLDLTADEGGDLTLSVVDQTDASAVVFQIDGLDDDIETVQVAFNGGDPIEVAVDGNGQFTADTGISLGTVEAVLTVIDDAANSATVETGFAVTPDGNPNADIAIESLDPVYFGDRLHFSFIQNPAESDGNGQDRSYKDTGTVRLTNTGTEVLEFSDATVTGPFDLADPTAFDALSLAPGASVDIAVTFDATEIQPKPGDAQNGVYQGALTLITNDAEDPIVKVDLAGFWQPTPEAGREPNINEVWQMFGFGNEIEGLDFDNGGESDVLDFFDLFLQADETEVMSPYWRIADGETSATITQIAAFHGPGGASLGIHGPGDKGGSNDIGFGGHNATHNQRILPLEGGSFFSETFDRDDIPDGWAGSDVFGIEVAGLSTDPTLNPSGSGTVQQSQLDARYPGHTVSNGVVTDPEGNVVPDGYTVRMFQAVDAGGAAIENVYLGVMDYTGINYDYNDNMFIIEGVTPVGFGGELAISNLTAAAADDRLVFSRIDNPASGSQSFADTQTFTITNAGIGALEIDGIDITGPFEIVGQAPATLAPGASADITIAFTGTDPSNDNQAVLHEGSLTVNTAAGSRDVSLAGLAQIQSEGGEEPTVAQIVQAFGYSSNVQQGQLNGGGVVETVGDEVLLPYLQRLDGSEPITVTQIAAYLSTGRVGHLNLHEVGSSALTELYTQGGNEAQTLLPTDGTGNPASATINRDGPFGLKVTVENFPTFSAWTDPEINLRDPAFDLGPDNGGHYIRYFKAIDGNGEVIEGRYIAIQDYPGGENFDYNDHMYVIDNVQAYDPAGAEDADGDGVVDTLITDTDGDGTVDFFDGDVTPPAGQAPFGGTAPILGETLTVAADTFDTGGQGIAWNDAEAGKDGGDTGARADSDVEIIGGDIAYVESGEWVEYTIDVAEAGTYDLSVVAKAPTDGAMITVALEDGTPLTTITLPDANGADNDGFGGTAFGATPAQQVSLAAGTQTLRFTFGGTIADNGYVLDMRSFTLDRTEETVPNQQPTTSGITGAPQGTEDEAYTFDVSGFFSDPDGDDTLTFSAENLPAGLSISDAGVISGTVSGIDGDLSETVTVTASDGELEVDASFDLTITNGDEEEPSDGQAPFGGIAPAVGIGSATTIAALAYDEGGQDVAYSDAPGLAGGTDGGRAGSDVEITALGDVGWVADGEWLEYTISVTSSGTYDISFDSALGSSGGAQRSVSFAFDDGTGFGQTVSADVDFTGGWTTFQTLEAGSVDLEAGTHVVRVTFNGGSQDLRSFTLDAEETAIVNEAPVIEPLGGRTVIEGDKIIIDLSEFISDPNLDDVIVTATGLPAELEMSQDGVITGSVIGISTDEVFTIEVTASDGELSTTESFDLTVEDTPEGPIGQAGSVTFTQPDQDTWLSVTFDAPLENPSVVMGPISFNGGNPSTMRVRDVTDTGFEFQLDEWNYLDGGHIEETVGWLAIESGVHELNGLTIVAGGGTASEASSQINFGHDFGSAPVVLGQVTSDNDPDAVTDRISGTSGTGFTVALDDEEANGSTHSAEDFSWIAISEGGSAASGLVAGATLDTVTHQPGTILFGDEFADSFVFIADMQSEDGGDPATIRLSDLSEGSATIFLEEETSNDGETTHTTEQVGWLAMDDGLIFV